MTREPVDRSALVERLRLRANAIEISYEMEEGERRRDLNAELLIEAAAALESKETEA